MNRVATLAAIAIAVAAAAAPLSAQMSQPYAGWQTRSIKALSGEQLAELRAGRGMARSRSRAQWLSRSRPCPRPRGTFAAVRATAGEDGGAV